MTKVTETITVYRKPKYAYQNMSHTGIKRHFFQLFSDFYRLICAELYRKNHDAHGISQNKNYFATFQISSLRSEE